MHTCVFASQISLKLFALPSSDPSSVMDEPSSDENHQVMKASNDESHRMMKAIE
jgi:hypothetical protein